MEKMLKQVATAIEYSKQHPNLSLTKVGMKFSIDRHQIVKYSKDDKYKKYIIENKANPQDKYLYYFNDNDIAAINAYLNNPTLPYNKIKNFCNSMPERRVMYRWLQILGKSKTEGSSIKYHYDRTKFKTIRTEEDAYWLGFITADGCIVEGKWLSIQLAARDIGHLKKFCKYMGLPESEINQIISSSFGGSYTKDNPVNGVKICSLEIINNLQDKGVFPRKSGNEKPYICCTKELQIAYIRGLIDGDGYIRSTQYGMGIVGSFDICNYVQNFISTNIWNFSKTHIRQHGIIYKFELAGHIQCGKILQVLYSHANIYLDRKYKLYQTRYTDCRG